MKLSIAASTFVNRYYNHRAKTKAAAGDDPTAAFLSLIKSYFSSYPAKK